MKFRHQSNFIELEVEQIVSNIISYGANGYVNNVKLAALLACMLTKGGVESVLKEFGYVKIDETIEE